MVNRRWWLCLVSSVSLASACDVPEPAPSTGGVSLDAGPCGHALIVVNSDYLSSSVAVASFDGQLLSGSLISSGSAAAGMSAALSGDVVAPLTTTRSGSVVLIDREQSVITAVRPVDGTVMWQMPVGFNPHDYLEVDATRAYVTRFGANTSPGQTPFDAGSDVVVIDRATRTVLKSIPLSAYVPAGYQPRPDRMLQVGHRAVVSLLGFTVTYDKASAARFVGISSVTDAVDYVVTLDGLSNCGGMALSPDGSRMAVSCSGVLADGTAAPHQSGIALLDMTVEPPIEVQRYELAQSLAAPLQPSIAFASNHMLLGTTYGDLTTKRPDSAFVLDTVSSQHRVIMQATEAFSLGEFRCNVGCSEYCLLTDSQRVGLRRVRIEGERDVVEDTTIPMGGAIGLPPRAMGGY